MTQETLLENISNIKGISPKILKKIKTEIDTYEKSNDIPLPYCNDVKIKFYNDFGYEGLENATECGQVKAYSAFWNDAKEGMQGISNILHGFAEITRHQDTYSGAVVTLEFCALNG
jgi:hypothetical protein